MDLDERMEDLVSPVTKSNIDDLVQEIVEEMIEEDIDKVDHVEDKFYEIPIKEKEVDDNHQEEEMEELKISNEDNVQTKEYIGFPPPGSEHFAFRSDMFHTHELSTNAAKEHVGIEFSCNAIQDCVTHGLHYKIDGFAHSDDHGTLKKIADELVSLYTPDVMDHLEDESDVCAYPKKQENPITSSEACSEPDASLEPCISNNS